MQNSAFSAELFDVVFTPNNRSLAYNVKGISNIAGKVEAEAELLVYGFSAIHQTLDPCDQKELAGMCPMNAGPLNINSNLNIDEKALSVIPGKPIH